MPEASGKLTVMRTSKAAGLLLIIAVAIAAIAGGAAAQSGYNYPPPTPPGTNLGAKPTLTLTVKRTSAKRARTRGIRVGAKCNVACVVKLRVFKGRKTYGKKTKVLPSKSGTLKVRLNHAAKRKLRKGGKKAFKFTVSGRATDATNRKSQAARAKGKITRAKGKRKG
jgi:hypothetical protein